MSKLYTITEKTNKGTNINHILKGSCRDAVAVLQEEIDPTLLRFEGEKYRYQSNSMKFINMLIDNLREEQGRIFVSSDEYK